MKKTRQTAQMGSPVDFGRRSGLKVYPISIGAMRLPSGQKAIDLLREAIDAGMVYIDTCRGYGHSELAIAKALKDGYREKVILSTKWSPWLKKVEPTDEASADCTYKRILESMRRLEVDYLDFYQIWSVETPEQFEMAAKKGGMLDGIRRAVDEGLVRHIGLTTHDTPENVSGYIERADWCEAILVTYNMFSRAYEDVLAKAHSEGIATLVMNPLGGGMLAEDSPVFKQAVSKAIGLDDPAEAAHRYLAGNENIDTILCGINKPSDIASTIANCEKTPLSAEQRKRLETELDKLTMANMGFCTGCKYCMPCTEGINIPAMMRVWYYDKLLNVPNKAAGIYNWNTSSKNQNHSIPPKACTKCGRCEAKCTQKIDIIQKLEEINKKYGNRNFFNRGLRKLKKIKKKLL